MALSSAITSAVTTAVTAVALALIFGLLNKSAGAPAELDPDAQRIELAHGRFVRKVAPWAFGIVPAVGFVVLAAFASADGSQGAATALLGIGVAFLAAAGLLFSEARHRVLVDGTGVTLVKGPGHERRVRWDDVRDVRYSGFWGALMLGDGAGTTVRVSTFLRGFDLFVDLVREKLGPERTEPAFRKLERMRRMFGARR